MRFSSHLGAAIYVTQSTRIKFSFRNLNMPLTKKAKAKAKAIAKARGRASCTHDSPNDEYEFQPPMNDSELQDQAKAKVSATHVSSGDETKAKANAKARAPATHDSSDDEYSFEELKKINENVDKISEDFNKNKVSYTELEIKRSYLMHTCERRDQSFAAGVEIGEACMRDLGFLGKLPKNKMLRKNTQTSFKMREDMLSRTDTPFYPWFQDHVKRSSKRSFTADYFTVGLVEEINKYKMEREKGEDWPPVGKHVDEVVCRAGNVYWYIYGLCSGMEDVIPETVDDDGYDWYYADVRELLGSLCGTVRKWIQGDQDWAVLRPQVQASVSRLLRYIRERSVRFTTPEMAMRFSIAKIRGRAFDKGDLREEMSYTGAAMKIHTNNGPVKVTDIRAMGDKMKAAEMREFMKNLNID